MRPQAHSCYYHPLNSLYILIICSLYLLSLITHCLHCTYSCVLTLITNYYPLDSLYSLLMHCMDFFTYDVTVLITHWLHCRLSSLLFLVLVGFTALLHCTLVTYSLAPPRYRLSGPLPNHCSYSLASMNSRGLLLTTQVMTHWTGNISHRRVTFSASLTRHPGMTH